MEEVALAIVRVDVVGDFIEIREITGERIRV
jgi:hypothetical protein